MTFAIRASLLHCLRDPGLAGDASAIQFIHDAIIVVRDGKFDLVGEANAVLPLLGNDIRIEDHRGQLLMPGFIDTHVHFPQIDAINCSNGWRNSPFLKKRNSLRVCTRTKPRNSFLIDC
jgi:guanine deaminase